MEQQLYENIKPFSVFKNPDGTVYTVIAIAKHSENKDENLVIYRDSGEVNEILYAKPIELFAREETRSICPGLKDENEKIEFEEGREVLPYTLWSHFKGAFSLVIGLAKNTETGENFVVYRCMKSDGITNHKDGVYARPLDMFLSPVDREKYSESQYPQFYRFTKTSSGVID